MATSAAAGAPTAQQSRAAQLNTKLRARWGTMTKWGTMTNRGRGVPAGL